MYNQNNTLCVLVGVSGTYPSSNAFVDNYADLTDGYVVVLDQDNNVMNTTTDSDTVANKIIRLAARQGDKLVYTPFFNAEKVISARTQAYAAPAEQVSYIGYVGSGTNNIQAIDNNDYIVRILLQDTVKTFGDREMWKFGAYRSDSSATSQEVAAGICISLTNNFSREPEKLIQFERVCDGTAAATTQNLTVTKNSKQATWSAARSATTVGEVLKIDGYVYLVDKILSTTVIELDQPYQGESITATSNATPGNDTVSTMSAISYWGIKCTGIARTNFVPGEFKYKKSRFSIQLSDFGSTTVTDSTAPSEGVGYYQEVQELEWQGVGNRGYLYHDGGPGTPAFTPKAVSTASYEYIHLHVYDDQGENTIVGGHRSPIEIIVAGPNGVNNIMFELCTVLNTASAIAMTVIGDS